MDFAKIQDLKRQLAICTNFASFWEYYLDNFADDPEFMNLGQPMDTAPMHRILGEIAVRALGKPAVALVNPMLIEQPESGLIHGYCTVSEYMMCIRFFLYMDLGMAILTPAKGKGETKYARFSITSPRDRAAAN